MSDNPRLNRTINPKLKMEVPNSLGFHKSSADLDVTIRKGGKSGHVVYNIDKAIIGLINTISFVGIFYYFIPGFNHIGTQGTSWQPTPAFLCITVFLILVSLIPSKKESK